MFAHPEAQQLVRGNVISENYIGGNARVIMGDVGSTTKSMDPQERLKAMLESLSFPHMDDREEEIRDPYARTFQWLLEASEQNACRDEFVKWINSDENHMYWICGKAGSGKSTLMKNLYESPKLREDLASWAGSEHIVFAGFFFYDSGTSALQKSREGLLRSIIYQILLQRKDLVPLALESNWSRLTTRQQQRRVSGADDSWKWSELKLIFDHLVTHLLKSSKLCLFVDGLDEYGTVSQLEKPGNEDRDAAGDFARNKAAGHVDIAQFLSCVATYKNLKLCVSSRPLLPFSYAFGTPHLQLEHLTSPDIEIYVDGRLDHHVKMTRLRLQDPHAAHQLTRDIVNKASGVFLWVRLVVDLLVSGLGDADSISELQDLLRPLPGELCGRDGLYMRMLKDIKPNHRQQAAHLFHIMQQAWNGVSLLEMSFAQEDPLATLGSPMTPWTTQMANAQAQTMEDRLKSRCQGLLETYNQDSRYEEYHCVEFADTLVDESRMIRYLHLSVDEFLLESLDWNTFLPGLWQPRLDGNFSLLNACVLKLKRISFRPGSASDYPWRTYIWNIILDGMHHAAALEKTWGHIVQSDSLIDELDKTATVLLDDWNHSDNLPNENSERVQYHWTMSAPQNIGRKDRKDMDAKDTFISFVVQGGLKSYIGAKLKQSGKVTLQKDGRPILDYAVAPHPCINKLHYSRWWDGFGTRLADPDLVELLLRYGANPNECYPHRASTYQNCKPLSSTVWRNALLTGVDCLVTPRQFRYQSSLSIDDLSRWIENVKLLIQHGADVNCKIETETLNSEYKSVIEAHSPLYWVARVLYGRPADWSEVSGMLVAKGAKYRRGEEERLRFQSSDLLRSFKIQIDHATIISLARTNNSTPTPNTQQKEFTSKIFQTALRRSKLKSVFSSRTKK